MSKYLKPLFLAAGAALFIWACQAVDLAKVGSLLVQLGFGFLLILFIYSFVPLLDTIAWRYNFKPEETKTFTLWHLWRIRQIGEAFNVITPLGTVGGEPVKAQLLKEHHGLSFKQGLASQIIARTMVLAGLILFIIPGIVFLFMSGLVSPAFKQASLFGLVGFSGMILIFFITQVKGTLSKVTDKVSRFPVVGKYLVEHQQQFRILDGHMSKYYREHLDRLVLSIAYATAGWLVGIGELYVTLYFLGFSPSFTDLWIIEALIQFVRTASFFIPMSLGALEGGLILIFVSMGFTADLGLAVSFIRRIKDLAWVALGLFLGWSLAFKPAKVQFDTSEGS